MKAVLFSLFLVALMFGSSTQVFAQMTSTGGGTDKDCTTSGCTLQDPLGFNGDSKAPQLLIGRIINTALGVSGSLALLVFVYGGFTWMTAAGVSEKVTKGKEIIVWAVIGLVVIFSAFAMTRFVLEALG